MCPHREFRSKSFIFSWKIEKLRKIGNVLNFSIILIEINWSCQNALPVQILFKNINFWGIYVVYYLKKFTRTLNRIYKSRNRYLSEKSCDFWSKAARAFKFGHFMPNMMHLKVSNYWGSRKIFSMCKIENAAGGAKLHPPGIGLIFQSSPIFTNVNERWLSRPLVVLVIEKSFLYPL